MKYESYSFDLSRFDMEDEEYQYVKLAHNEANGSRVLFVLDVMPKEDLDSGRLLSGLSGDILRTLLSYSRSVYGRSSAPHDWLAVTFNAFRTSGKPDEFRNEAKEAFKQRIEKLIAKYKPEYVVAFGKGPMDALIGHKIVNDDKGVRRYGYWLGVPVPCEVSGHKFHTVSNLSINDVAKGDSAEASLLGFMSRCLASIYGKRYLVSKDLMKHTPVLIKSMDDFNALMKKLKSKPVLSIDTEAKNLHKVTNKLYTVQFAYDTSKGFIVPIYHKDAPFNAKETDRIVRTLKDFFEEAPNEYHIYANAKFDLTLLRDQLSLDFYKADVWDIFGGEFALDENKKSLQTVLGEYYYSLANLAVQYGFEGYLNAEFGKADRKNFTAANLNDKATQFYCSADVVVPFAIHEIQKRIAKDTGYTKFEDVVRYEVSDTLHAFSTMEHTGARVDIPYLFYLRSEKSPIEDVIRDMEDKLLTTDSAKKAVKLLGGKKGVPEGGALWGSEYTSSNKLTLSRNEDKRALFFDVLKLKPLEKGVVDKKTGVAYGKLDKAFQAKYANVPEVAAFTALEKAKKLRNAYVKSFIKMLGESEDFQHDKRIRPNYGYLGVVTHRTSCSDPNLQQVPSRSELGKHIKRLFIAREGCLIVKVDYKAHEVRGWGIVAFDKAIAELFASATALFDEYRRKPTKELKKRLKLEADIHVLNACYFFGITAPEVIKPIRDAVKSVVFGVIYQKSAKSLAKDLGKEKEYTEDLMNRMFKRFGAGKRWIDNTIKSARKSFYVEAPTGIRRHLYGYLLPKSHPESMRIYGEMDRRAVNSPIQGMCSKMMMSSIRNLNKEMYRILKEQRRRLEMYLTNSVHDSLESEAAYKDFIKSIAMIETCMTEGVRKTLKRRHKFDMISTPEVDFELGAAMSHCESWDFSAASLERIVLDSLLFQRNVLKYKIKVHEVKDLIFAQIDEDAPKWLKDQIKNIGYKFDLTERSYIEELKADAKETIADATPKYEKIKDSKDEDDVKTAKQLASAIKDANKQLDYSRQLYKHMKEAA